MQPKATCNRPWELTSGADAILRIGDRRLPVRQITGVAREAREERNFLGSLLMGSVYLLVAAVFLILVVQAGWRERFLLATAFFAVVGFTSIIDIGLATPIRLYKLRITLADTAQIDFTTADPAEVDALFEALQRAGHHRA